MTGACRGCYNARKSIVWLTIGVRCRRSQGTDGTGPMGVTRLCRARIDPMIDARNLDTSHPFCAFVACSAV
ncbi:MAG TPA: hypothetical protein PLJ31_01210 [Armatimonadota bacterium]|nr:hypothetical protein [Armatimonadota bacterium]